MGIGMQELLSLEYFKDFYVLAGKNGLNKEVQGITLFEAPDAFCWTRGKELVFTSGYVFKQEPDCIYRAFRVGTAQKMSGMMIKRERYMDEVPEKMIQLFDEYDIPLISMPFQVSWMEVMNQVNTAVMNRTIRRFRINTPGENWHVSNLSYKEQKIKRILQAVEVEMKFPAFLYDFKEEKSYYSSINFRRIADSFGLDDADFWEPSVPYTKHTLCDFLDMVRYRMSENVAEEEEHEKGSDEKPKVSWIRIPICMQGSVQAVFVVMESRELLDYYDEYAIRIAFLTLQGVYEQIMVAQKAGNIGFENFVLYALNSAEEDTKKLLFQANAQGLSTSTEYISAMFRPRKKEANAKNRRDEIMGIYQKGLRGNGKIAFIGENEGILLIEFGESGIADKEQIIKLLRQFRDKVQEMCPELNLDLGISTQTTTIPEFRKSFEKCKKALNVGELFLAEQQLWEYEKLGVLAWIEVPQEVLDKKMEKCREYLRDEKNVELFETLKVYLDNNMNYSTTAKKMYVHINTIRKRIDKINSMMEIDWDDPLARMNVELLLRLFKID